MHKKVKKENPIIAYKGFDEDLSCRGFQYKIGKEYCLEGELELCSNGFHACQNPLDVFVYYPMSSYTRYAMVMLWGDVDFANDGKKICATDIMIVKEIGIDEMVTVGIMYSFPKIKINENDKTSHDMIISRKNADSIYNPHYVGRVASCGSNTSILSTGHWQKIASSGEWADIVATGACAEISTSGYYSRIISHGDDVNVASAGMAKIYSDGKNATLYANCTDSQIASIGDKANICISSTNGYVNSCGSDARIMSLEDKSTIESNGEKALVMSAGHNTRARAKVGSWIVLTEYDDNKNIKCVKAEYVDGERIKGDTLYRLVNGEFVKTI